MTYNVFGGTLYLAQSNPRTIQLYQCFYLLLDVSCANNFYSVIISLAFLIIVVMLI